MASSGMGGMGGYIPPTMQAHAVLSQNNPVSGQLYTILALTANCRLISAEADCTWTVQPDPLDIVITIDGQVIVHTTANPVSTTGYSAMISSIATAANQGTGAGQFLSYQLTRPFLYEGKSILVQARITGGTVSNLSGRVIYATW